MQNQLSSSVNLGNGQSPGLGSPKFSTQNYMKPFDRPLPPTTLKHYSSNPNLSLEMTHPRPPTQPIPDFSQFNSHLAARNHENRSYISPNARPRSDLTKSLIITEADRRETPEELPEPKKDLARNMARRPRMSETI